MTFDTKTKVLFSSDIFGSYDRNWSLYTQINEACADCKTLKTCPLTGRGCQMAGILNFHERIMNSTRALHYALDRISALDVSLIAPQHGGILDSKVAQTVVISKLKSLKNIGFDYFLKGEGK